MQLAEGELRTHNRLHHALKGAAACEQAAKPHTDLHELTTQMLLHRAVENAAAGADAAKPHTDLHAVPRYCTRTRAYGG